MRIQSGLLFTVLFSAAGCGATAHGPPVRVVSATTTVRNLGVTSPENISDSLVDRETVRETRLSDERGREWTEATVIATERVSMAQIKAELFEEAQRKTALNAR